MSPPNNAETHHTDMLPAQSITAAPNSPPPNLPPHFDPTSAYSPTPTPTSLGPYYTEDKYENTGNHHPSTSSELDRQHTIDTEMGDHNGKKRRRRRMEGRSACIRCLCCACCLPGWAAGILWFIIIAIIIVVIVLGAIAGTFIMPTVDMAGVSTKPTTGSQISFTGDGLRINFGLIVEVNNPNLLGIDLSDINATAYYPKRNGGHTQIGGGYLEQQAVPKYSHFNFTFPFHIEYNPSYDLDQSVLNDIADKCGLTGGKKQDITIDYTIHLAAKVLMIKIHPTISSSATFTCPIESGELSGLGDGTIGL